MSAATENNPHDIMRRKDREITSRTEINEIIATANLMHIAMVDGDQPFLVPVFYAFDDSALYFHSAQAGSKTDILNLNTDVCFEISADKDIIESDAACDLEAKHCTVIGLGKAISYKGKQKK